MTMMMTVTANMLALSSDHGRLGFVSSRLRSYRNPPGVVDSVAWERRAHVGDGAAASDSHKLTSHVPSPGRPTFEKASRMVIFLVQ